MSKFFLPYQTDWINNNSRYSIYLKARQIGITFACAYWSFRRRMTTKIDHLFCSANFKTSQEFIRYVKQFAQATNISLQQSVINEEDFQNECVQFPNGSRIIIVSSNPTALRGFRGDCVWDEAAFHDHSEEFFRAALPVTTWGGQMHIISTHNGPSTTFHEVLKKAEAGDNQFKVFKTTLQDAIDQGLADKVPGEHRLIADPEERKAKYIKLQKQNCLSEAMWEQEFCCQVLSEGSLVSPENYDKVIVPNFKVARDTTWTIDLNKCGDLYLGFDPARSGDHSVIYIVEEGIDAKQTNPELRTVYRTVLVKVMKNIPFQAQYDIMLAFMRHPKLKKAVIEINGIGSMIGEQVANAFPSKTIQWYTTSANKQKICERVSAWVAQEKVSLPADEDIRADILSMKRIPNGAHTRYEGRSGSSHADCYMAIALALQGTQDAGVFEFMKA